MPVIVETPIHLIVDEISVTERRAEIDQALRRAIEAAMQRAKLDVLDDRGGYMGVKILPPEITYSGEAARSFNRSEFASDLWDLILNAAERTGTFAHAAAAERIETPLQATPQEVRDSHRYHAIIRRYRLPQYDDGKNTSVEVDGDDEPQGHYVRHWTPVNLSAINPQTLWNSLRDYIGDQFPPTEDSALIYRRNESPLEFGLFMVGTNGRGLVRNIGGFQNYHYDEANHRFVPTPAQNMKPQEGTLYRFRFDGDDAINGEHLRRFFESEIREQLGHYQRPEGVGNDEFVNAIDQTVTNELTRRARDLGQNRTVIILEMGDSHLVFPTDSATEAALPFQTSCRLWPFSTNDFVEGPDTSGEGDGSGAGQGSGAQGTNRGGGGQGNGNGTGTQGGGGRPGSPIFVGQDGSGNAKFHFPGLGGEDGAELTCEAFQDEPSCDEMGDIGTVFKARIDEIAARLDISPCYLPAHFTITAATVIKDHATTLANYTALAGPVSFYQPVTDPNASIDVVRIVPTVSPAVQILRYLAGTIAKVTDLQDLILSAYDSPALRERVVRNWYSNIASWLLHYLMEISSAMDDAVEEIFEQGCRVVFLQLLETSRQQIQGRIDNFAVYGPLFAMMVQKWLRQPAELTDLRDRLSHFEEARWVRDHSSVPGDSLLSDAANTAIDSNPLTAWVGAAHAVSGLFMQAHQAMRSTGEAGEIIETNGVARIRDSQGQMWTKQELEDAIVTVRGEAEDIDPLIKQIRDLPDVFSEFQNHPTAALETLRNLLTTMIDNNAEMTQKTIWDPMFAFRASSMVENIPGATIPGSEYALMGIHMQVHSLIGEFFHGSYYYARGVDQAISSELGKQAIENFVIGVGIVALCVFCAPLGFLAGVAAAVHELDKAYERERLFMSLIDPELVLTRAEVEVQKFAAWLGFALSVIPEAGTILGTARAGIRGGLKAGLRAGAREAAEYAATRISREIVESLEREFLPAFIRELAMNEVMNRVIETALSPILEAVQHNAMITTSPGGSANAAQILDSLARSRGGATP